MQIWSRTPRNSTGSKPAYSTEGYQETLELVNCRRILAFTRCRAGWEHLEKSERGFRVASATLGRFQEGWGVDLFTGAGRLRPPLPLALSLSLKDSRTETS